MRKASRTKNTIMNTVVGCLVKSCNILTNFLLRTVFIRCLGAEYNGVSSLFTDILQVLSFAELGIATAITFELYKPLANGDKNQIAKLMCFYKKAYRVVAGCVFLTGILIVPFLDRLIIGVPDVKENLTLIYLLYLVNTVVSYLLIYKATLLIADQQKYVVSGIEISIVLIKTVIQSMVLWITHNFIIFLLIMIAATVMQNLMISIKVNHKYPFIIKTHETLDRSKKIDIYRDIRALSLYKICGTVLNGIDSVFISVFSGTVQVGFLANYKLIMSGVQGTLQQFFGAVEPSIGNLVIKTNKEKQYGTFQLMNFVTFWITCISSAMFIALYTPFVTLWVGSESVLSMSIVIPLVLNFYIAMMMCPVASFRTSNGLFTQGQYRPLFMLLLNILFSAIMGRSWGVFGVLMATVCSRVFTQVWYDPFLIYSRIFHTGCKKYFQEYLQFTIITLVTCSITYSICVRIILKNCYIEFLVKLGISFFFSNAMLFLLMRNHSEFRILINIIQNIKKRKEG